MTRRNSVKWEGDESMAAIRAGQRLLVGLLRCGHCKRERVFYLVLVAVAVIRLWVAPIRSSLWLDETVTYWIIEGGYAKIFARAAGRPGQSPLYYLVAWLAQLADGNNVATLRLPSLIAMIAAAWLLYKLAERLFDAETAPLATLVFVCSEQVVFEAADARPYALGLCLLTASCLMLLRWLDTGGPHYGAGYSLLVGLTIYAQIFLAIALVWHGVYALYRSRREGLVTLPALMGAWVAAGLLCVPLLPQLLEDFHSRGSHSFATTPAFSDLLFGILPPVLAAALGLLIGWLGVHRSSEGYKGAIPSRQSMILATGWALLPPAALYLVSISTATKLFVPRYFIAAAPALALVVGAWIRAIAGAPFRAVVALAILAITVRSFGTWQHGDEDWAGAMAKVRALTATTNTPVLMASGLVEASGPETLEVPQLREYLFAPLARYPINANLIRLPFQLDGKSEPYLEKIVATDLQNRASFIFVGRRQGLTFEPWLRGRLASRGFRSESQGNFGYVGVFLFSRDARADQ